MNPVVDSQLVALDQLKWFAGIVLKGDLDERARFYQVHPGTSHIHWLVGHVSFTLDRIALTGLQGRAGLPDAYGPVFGFGVKPMPDPTAYPGWDQIVADLDGTMDRLRAHAAALTDADLDRPLPSESPFAKRFPSQRAMIPFACLHSAYHLGQVSTLRRAQGLPSGMAL